MTGRTGGSRGGVGPKRSREGLSLTVKVAGAGSGESPPGPQGVGSPALYPPHSPRFPGCRKDPPPRAPRRTKTWRDASRGV